MSSVELGGVRNVRLPPQLALHPQYIVVHPQYHHVYHQQPVVPQPSGMSSIAASRQNPSKSRQSACLQQQHCYQNVPEIVVDQPDNIQCGDSATFQRLGLREASESLVSEDAKALETRGLAMAEVSPPETSRHHQSMEMLTPSPVSLITPDQSSVQEGHSFPLVTPKQGKLHQVRMMNYPVNRTPYSRTPEQALIRRKSSLKTGQGRGFIKKSVTVVQPQIYVDKHPSRGPMFSVLETSDQGNTIVTTGDLNDLVSIDQTNDDSSRILDRNYSSSTNDSKTITPGSCVASPPSKSNLKTQDIKKLYYHYYPNITTPSKIPVKEGSSNLE